MNGSILKLIEVRDDVIDVIAMHDKVIGRATATTTYTFYVRKIKGEYEFAIRAIVDGNMLPARVAGYGKSFYRALVDFDEVLEDMLNNVIEANK